MGWSQDGALHSHAGCSRSLHAAALTSLGPQVLLLLPMRHLARGAVLRLCQLAQQETRTDSIQGKARFLEEYADPPPGEGAWVFTGQAKLDPEFLACRCELRAMIHFQRHVMHAWASAERLHLCSLCRSD